MKSMNCHNIRTKIEEAELDQYPGDEATAHLRACEPCRDFQRERAALRRLVGSLEAVSAPADFDYRLRARLAAAKSAGRPGIFRFLFAPGAPAIALAASFAVLVAAAVIFKHVELPHSNIHQRAELTAAVPAPSSSAPSPQAVEKREAKASTENPDRTRNANDFVKSAETGPKILTAELKTRSRSNRISRQGDERLVPSAANVVAVGRKNNSQEFSGSAAPVISLVAVPVPTTNQPTRISLEDGRGTTRTVSLQPVTFGSQELIERNGASRVLATSPKGIW
jgi:hypothetical protein